MLVLLCGILGTGLGIIGRKLNSREIPVRISATWHGKVELDRFDLPRAGIVEETKTFEIIWKEWCAGAVPKVDFESDIVFFLKGNGSGNRIVLGGIEPPFEARANGVVKINGGMTMVKSAGFNCLLIRTRKIYVATINGEPATTIDLRNATPNNEINERQEIPLPPPLD